MVDYRRMITSGLSGPILRAIQWLNVVLKDIHDEISDHETRITAMEATDHEHVINEEPPEPVNGSNVNFSTSQTFKAGSVRVLMGRGPAGGVEYVSSPISWTEDADRQGITWAKAPPAGWTIWISYEVE